jgi:prophage regulatory protein
MVRTPLRVPLESSSDIAELSQHDAAGNVLLEYPTGGLPCQPTATSQQNELAIDDPALGQNDKRLAAVGRIDDFDSKRRQDPRQFCAKCQPLELSDLPPEAFMRLPQVISVVGLRRSTIYELIKKGRFPAPCKLTAHASGWRVGLVRSWLLNPKNWRAAHRTVE